MILKIVIRRAQLSLHPVKDPAEPASFSNNNGNNLLDLWTIFDDETPLFSCKVQTVANLEGLDPGVHYVDTVAPGPFQIRFQVDRREFYCAVNGIVNTKTLAGETIIAEVGPDGKPTKNDSTTVTNKSRWLNHDMEFAANSGRPAGQDCFAAWSAGCFVMQDLDLRKSNFVLSSHGVQPGDLVDGILEMEA